MANSDIGNKKKENKVCSGLLKISQTQKKSKIENTRLAIIAYYCFFFVLHTASVFYHMFFPELKLPFIIAETEQTAYVSISVADILDIFLIGFGFMIFLFIAFFNLVGNPLHFIRRNIERKVRTISNRYGKTVADGQETSGKGKSASGSNNSPLNSDEIPPEELLCKGIESELKSLFPEYLMYIMIAFLWILFICMGNFVHLAANSIHAYLDTMGNFIYTGSDLSPLFDAIYFWDEKYSHIFVCIGYSGLAFYYSYINAVFTELPVVESKDTEYIKLKKLSETSGILMGIVFAVGMIEGQFAVYPLPVYIIALYLLHKYRRKGYFVLATEYFMVSYILSIVIYACIFGVKPVDPYLKQISELISY